MLLLVCLVWGGTFVVVKEAVAEIPTLTFLALRFLLATAVLAAVFRRDVVATWRRLAWPGVVTGFWLGAGYLLQTLGLESTDASRAGFITGLAVVLVPLFSAVITRERPSRQAVVGVALALLGLVFLFVVPGVAAAEPGPVAAATERVATGAPTAALPVAGRSRLAGDLLVLGCTVAFALHIVTTGHYSATRARSFREAGALATLQVGAASLGYLLACLVRYLGTGLDLAALFARSATLARPFSLSTAGAIAMTGLLATAGAFLAQAVAQRHTPPTHTALIFASEPVFAAFFGWLLLGENLGPWSLTGCALILSGMLVAEIPRSGRAATGQKEPAR